MKGRKASGMYHFGPNFHTSCVALSCLSLSVGVDGSIGKPPAARSDSWCNERTLPRRVCVCTNSSTEKAISRAVGTGGCAAPCDMRFSGQMARGYLHCCSVCHIHDGIQSTRAMPHIYRDTVSLLAKVVEKRPTTNSCSLRPRTFDFQTCSNPPLPTP